MRVVTTRAELAAARTELAGRVAVVMTMGALHDGHRDLLRSARQEADAVVATVFVNPLQFGAGEDLDRYPRQLDADLAVCADEQVDLVFAPPLREMYPQPPVVRVDAGEIGERYEGAVRPGHFDGVLTVVLKLLHLVRPELAVFGQKDAQQLAAVRQMVRDFDLPVQVLAVPTAREPDGLARSSRNAYLSPEQRLVAPALYRALSAGSADQAAAELAAAPGVRVDYLDRVDPDTFQPDPAGRLLVGAVRLGTTRLIDNVALGEGTG